MYLPLLLPGWTWCLRQSWRHAKQAHDELRLYLHEMIKSRRELKEQQVEEFRDQKHDLFKQLIYARDAEDMLTEAELIGNVFIFLIGGPETTAHTFAIILGLLALYPSIQDKLVNQIHELQDQHGGLSYSHIHELTYAMAVIYETTLIAEMVTLISNYEVSIDESRFKPFDGESILEQRARLIDPEERLTLSPAPISLVFSQRHR